MTLALAVLLAACGGGGGGDSSGGSNTPVPTPAPQVSPPNVSALVTGQTSDGLVLQVNGANDLAVSKNGVATFSAAVPAGAFTVSIKQQPAQQTCQVINPAGTAGATPVSVAVHCLNNNLARFALLLDDSNGYSYPVDPVSGQLVAAQGKPFASDSSTVWDADPQARFIFSFDQTLAQIYTAAVDAHTGLPGPINKLKLPGTPVSTAAGVTGEYLYVGMTTQATGALVSYRVDSTTGQLTQVGVVAMPDGPSPLAVDPAGRFIYTTRSDFKTGCIIETWKVMADGSLTLANTFKESPDRDSVAILTPDPTGRFIYSLKFTQVGNGIITQGYMVDNAGVLTRIAGSITQTGSTGVPPTIDPTGHYLITGSVTAPAFTAHTIDQTTGVLTERASLPAPYDSPLGRAFDPSGRAAFAGGTNGVMYWLLNDVSNTSLSQGIALLPTPQSPFYKILLVP